jgi:hypothetical protein
VRKAAKCLVLALSATGCGVDAEPASSTALTRQQLLDPETCAACHSDHYQEWSGSMHAYAAEDPLFLAMNARAQREAGLGDFCVKCHAPLAVREGMTTDGLNLAQLPRQLKGVTCYFCHSAEAVKGTHDNPVQLADDKFMRAAIADPLPNPAHASSYSGLQDRSHIGSADLCGSCHDIQNQHGVDLERTFSEWRSSAFAQAPGGTTCGQCHMAESKALTPAAYIAGAVPRRTHAHDFPAVDLALGAFPNRKAQRASVQRLLDTTVQSALCVRGLGSNKSLMVILDNVAAGHAWPSGVAHDRRAWVELNGDQTDELVYQSGVVPTGMSPTLLDDPDLWLLRDCGYDQQGKHVAMFWEARGIESLLLPGQLTFDATDRRFYQTHVYRTYPRAGGTLGFDLDRVSMQLHLSPVGLDVADDLIESGDLEPAVREQLTTFDVGALLVWTADTATEIFSDQGVPMSCISSTNLRASADKVPAPAAEHCSN